MGLDCSHDAFHGTYSAFNSFRHMVGKAIGGSYPPHSEPNLDSDSWYGPEGSEPEDNPGISIFLSHSDCDGSISPEDCALVAEDLEKILPQMDSYGSGGGHIARAGGYGAVCRKFINGCRWAAANNECLEFR